MRGKLVLEQLSILHYLGAALAAVSGIIHLYLGFLIGLTDFLGFSFILAGIGFFGGIVAVFTGFRLKLVYLMGIPFNVGQIVLWYMINQPDLAVFIRGEPLMDFVDKVAQILLTFILVYLYLDEK